MNKLRLYWEFARPFTLLMPAIGMLSGGLVAWGAEPRFVSTWADATWKVVLNLILGALMAAAMNAGSNGLNQLFDVEIDRVNKPRRPLPSRRLHAYEAWKFTTIALLLGLMLAWTVNGECLLLALIAAILTACYSVPPVRTKRWGFLANVTVAIPRGFLLLVAGWSTVKTIAMPEPWLLCLPLGLFILGANSTKDFSDIPGDRRGGCRTLPVRYGIRTTALIIAPFFVLPFFIWALLAKMHYLSVPPRGIYMLSVILALLGAYVDFCVLRNPEELSQGENHISWKLISLMAMVAYVGLAVLYLLRLG